MPTVNELTALMNIFKNQTPSSPGWFQIVDVVVGMLLTIEIERATNAAFIRDATDDLSAALAKDEGRS